MSEFDQKLIKAQSELIDEMMENQTKTLQMLDRMAEAGLISKTVVNNEPSKSVH